MVKTRKFLSAAIVLALLFLAGVVALPQPVNAAQDWVVTIPFTSSENNLNLAFGTDTVATDGYDAGIDIGYPGGPPNTAEAYFSIVDPLFPTLNVDYRLTLGSAAGSTITWSLHMESPSQAMTLTWGDISTVASFP
ncbi:MAG: hypothetical protein KAX25_06710, partial [Dehalococcoidia bacterium]|nr:hypothetical protein [Dehalococcoidia bacterium]